MRLPILFLCAALAAGPAAAAELLMFGEMHDQPDQQRQVAEAVQQLAGAGRLAAVVLEMAEVPHTTAGLPREATEPQVREALRWQGWPWDAYAAVVMNAVRAGVPVLGGNLPRASLREAMRDAALDARIDDAARARLTDAVRVGHCHLLPATQEPGMVRVQVARDQSLARVAAEALRSAPPDGTVLLLAGAQHVSRDRGIPLHLAPGAATGVRVVMFGSDADGLQADERRPAAFTPQADHCATLRKQLKADAPPRSP